MVFCFFCVFLKNHRGAEEAEEERKEMFISLALTGNALKRLCLCYN
jgi:hypothetical protein